MQVQLLFAAHHDRTPLACVHVHLLLAAIHDLVGYGSVGASEHACSLALRALDPLWHLCSHGSGSHALVFAALRPAVSTLQPHDSVAHSSGSAHDLAAAISGLEGRTSGLSSVGEGSQHGKSGSQHGKSGSQHGNQAAAALLSGRESSRSGLGDRNSSKSGALDSTAGINVPGKK